MSALLLSLENRTRLRCTAQESLIVEMAPAAEQGQEPVPDSLQEMLHVGVVERTSRVETGAARGVPRRAKDSIENEGMEMRIQVHRRPEALRERHRSRPTVLDSPSPGTGALQVSRVRRKTARTSRQRSRSNATR
jgi:hypothetical protein